MTIEEIIKEAFSRGWNAYHECATGFDYENSRNDCLTSLNEEVEKLNKPAVSGSFPTYDEVETAALNYRDKSDDENTDENDNIQVNWWDKQRAFIAGCQWLRENYR